MVIVVLVVVVVVVVVLVVVAIEVVVVVVVVIVVLVVVVVVVVVVEVVTQHTSNIKHHTLWLQLQFTWCGKESKIDTVDGGAGEWALPAELPIEKFDCR